MPAAVYDAYAWSNISVTPANFELKGGRYMVTAVATWSSGTVTLNKLGPDGSTLIAVSPSAAMSVNGGFVADLSPGQYQLTIATATAVYAEISRIPES